MSDPAEEPDIEDVLASVRRLVTAERRERPATPSALVLTPSQRVEKAPTPLGTAEDEGSEDSWDIPEEAREVDDGLADAAWEDDEPQDAFESWRQERLGGPVPADDEPSSDLRVDAVPTIDGSAQPEARAEADDPADGEGEGPEADPFAEVGSVEAALDAAELEAVESEMDEADPDGPEPSVATFRHDPEPEIASVGPGSTHPLFEDAEAPADGEDYAETDDVELEGITDVDPDAVEDAEIVEDEPPADGASDPADVLDEETLRAMIADIVRQELRGPLGERITSNVRKLVRREIHRILAARDFE